MRTAHEASRTLVKSPPELWAECSDAGSLARHLGEFGEIRITRLEPESTVAWEGEHASGTVRIEPSGWGTRVTLTAETKAAEVVDPPPPADDEPDPHPPADGSAEEGVLPAPGESPTGGAHSDEEASDATPEEALEGLDPEPVADDGHVRGRWRRLTARMRGLFAVSEATTDLPEGPDLGLTPETELVSSPEIEAPEAPEELALPEDLEPPEEPEPDPDPDPDLDPTTLELNAEAILTSALDSLGQAHHRPFSRA
jgi:hypothetical protein